ncbi:hypothetical protein B0H16DRAFT_1676270 [Mycena metata]|uniref:Uncharacterized protein n=1 Tax=Mycena metata TaxID=1033252 RepID=A0AAD7IFR5_9AGAR|nr:hypothetical protein B0H16DRAFT_1676270 [Mycena metata]
MGLHFYDDSPSGPFEQRGRLGPPLAITQAGIPCVVWAEDALSIVHRVPTGLFDLQLLVPDDKVPESVGALCASLPYHMIADEDNETSHWRDMRQFNLDRPHAFKLGSTDTVVLSHVESSVARTEEVPERILVHRASTFHFDMNDTSRTMLNPDPPDPAFAHLRFPTVSAFLDSMMDTLFEPPVPMQHMKFQMRLAVYRGYIVLYTISDKGIFSTDEHVLLPRILEVLDTIKEENRPNLIRRYLDLPCGGYEVCALERQALKAARFEGLGLRYEPPMSIPYSPLTHRLGRPSPVIPELRQTPYLIRNHHNELSIQWRALARYTSAAAKLVR